MGCVGVCFVLVGKFRIVQECLYMNTLGSERERDCERERHICVERVGDGREEERIREREEI